MSQNVPCLGEEKGYFPSHGGANWTPPPNITDSQNCHNCDKTQNPRKLENIKLDSYKLAKPRFYTPNDFQDQGETILDRLNYLSAHVGPKGRTQQYNDGLTRLLQLSNPRKIKKKKPVQVAINTISTGPNIKLIDLHFKNFKVAALVDTGATHCLISADSYQKLENVPFMPIRLHMKVAGHVLKDNIIGKAQIPVSFETKEKTAITLYIDFLIAHVLNGYDAILGADVLMNEELLTAITPTSLILTENYKNAVIPL